MADLDQTTIIPPIRAEMIDAAVRFLTSDKVRQTPIDDQIQFLRTKGLTDDEIREAQSRVVRLAPIQSSNNYSNQSMATPSLPSHSTAASIQNVANTVVLVCGLSYAGYRLIRGWLLPHFFDVPDPATEQLRRLDEQINELQNSMKFVMDSVQQTLQSVQQQQDNLNRSLTLLADRDRNGLSAHQMNQLQTDVAVVKGLLLNRNQFAAVPDGMHVPSWQREATLSNDFKTPPSSIINGHRNGSGGGNFDKYNQIVDDDDLELSTNEPSSAV